MDEYKPKLCRICLHSSSESTSLFEQLGEMLIYEYVMFVAVVNILPNDGLPDAICRSCLLELKDVIKFKNKCEKSDYILCQSKTEVKDIEVTIKSEAETKSLLEEYKLETEEIEADFSGNDISQKIAENETKLTVLPLPAKGQLFSPQCNECGQYFRSKCKMRVHWKKQHWHTTFRHCENCKKIFKTKVAYERHNQNKKCSDLMKNGDKVTVIGKGKDRIFQCNHCEYNTKRYIHVKNHWVVHTPGEKPFKCKICSKAFTQRGTLNTHTVAKHDPSKRPTCHVCGKTMQSNQAMQRHMKFHQVIPVKCQVCNRSYKNNLTLKIHMTRHTNFKSRQCEKCPKTFYTVSELITHRKIHKKIKCTFCDFECANKEFMNKHEVKHGADQLIPCTQCGRFYESTKHLLKHLREYHKPKVFRCTMCPKAYGRQYGLTVHMKGKHNFVSQDKQNPTKTFKCRMCPRLYTNTSHLNVHVRNKHNSLEKSAHVLKQAKVEQSSDDCD